jgi:hypothetical protein
LGAPACARTITARTGGRTRRFNVSRRRLTLTVPHKTNERARLIVRVRGTAARTSTITRTVPSPD